jgi:hypothetical protein
MDSEYVYENLDKLIKASGVHRLIICSELKISLACLDDFIEKRQKPTSDMLDKLCALLNKYC